MDNYLRHLNIIRKNTGYCVLWEGMTSMSKMNKYIYLVLCRKCKSTESSLKR